MEPLENAVDYNGQILPASRETGKENERVPGGLSGGAMDQLQNDLATSVKSISIAKLSLSSSVKQFNEGSSERLPHSTTPKLPYNSRV
jgi:hypothetical protein